MQNVQLLFGEYYGRNACKWLTAFANCKFDGISRICSMECIHTHSSNWMENWHCKMHRTLEEGSTRRLSIAMASIYRRYFIHLLHSKWENWRLVELRAVVKLIKLFRLSRFTMSVKLTDYRSNAMQSGGTDFKGETRHLRKYEHFSSVYSSVGSPKIDKILLSF